MVEQRANLKIIFKIILTYHMVVTLKIKQCIKTALPSQLQYHVSFPILIKMRELWIISFSVFLCSLMKGCDGENF